MCGHTAVPLCRNAAATPRFFAPLVVCQSCGLRHRSARAQEFKISVGDVIAERYTVTRHLGSAAFSRAVAAADGAAGGAPVCLKVRVSYR